MSLLRVTPATGVYGTVVSAAYWSLGYVCVRRGLDSLRYIPDYLGGDGATITDGGDCVEH